MVKFRPPSDVTCLAYVQGAMHENLRRIVALQSDVLADQDPEPLHQLRVNLRQLKTLRLQFSALGVWPEEVSAPRIAKLGRRLGLTRDLDVLRQRIEVSWLPLLPEAEVVAIKPFRKQLKRERRLAFAELSEILPSQRYLKLLSRLQVWIKSPTGTAQAAEPVRDWLPELQGQLIGDLFLLPGWTAPEASDPGSAAVLHQLRKRLKTLRYGLAHFHQAAVVDHGSLLAQLKALQDCLGDLNDLVVLRGALRSSLDLNPKKALPRFTELLDAAQDQAWLRWLELSQAWRTKGDRLRLYQRLLGLTDA